ncbi:hypothetical protein PIB30_040694 [Stylosanthes scabra]|uniref:Uncharacterized protein n=1 Tax=Stylosanthes scabra TaxID=79078 RepID=A0ABU6RFE0_9FABA|nr:hypothetical protein [Stylosanthes scabra]
MGHDDQTGFFFWGMVHGFESVDPLRRIGEATDQASVLSGLGHCQTELAGDGILTMIIESTKGIFMPPVLAEGTWVCHRVHRERSRSPGTPLPPMAPAPGPVYPMPRTPMCDARRYRSLFPHRRVAPPTPPPLSPPPSDEEPSAETYDPAAELVGDPDEPYVADSSGSVSLGYGSASSGSASDKASDDDLVNRYFAGTFPPP